MSTAPYILFEFFQPAGSSFEEESCEITYDAETRMYRLVHIVGSTRKFSTPLSFRDVGRWASCTLRLLCRDSTPISALQYESPFMPAFYTQIQVLDTNIPHIMKALKHGLRWLRTTAVTTPTAPTPTAIATAAIATTAPAPLNLRGDPLTHRLDRNVLDAHAAEVQHANHNGVPAPLPAPCYSMDPSSTT